jgi:hypothetical protein
VVSGAVLALALVWIGLATLVHQEPGPASCTTTLSVENPATIDPGRLCSLTIAGPRPGVLPDIDQVTAQLGAPRLTWTLGAPSQPQTLFTDGLEVVGACLGSGSLHVNVTSKVDWPVTITIGCGADGRIGPGFFLPGLVEGASQAADPMRTFTFTVQVIGQVTAAEYFVI